jgi:hypothetical protein
MAVPTFQALVGDLRTGKITTRLPLTGVTWQAVLNGAGSITGATVNIAAADVRPLDVPHAAAPAKAFLAIQYDQSILNAGPIWIHAYNRSSGIVTLGATGLWGLFDHRLIIPVLAEPLALGAVQSAAGDTIYPSSSNLSLGDIAAALVAQALAHVGGNLPLVAPAAQGMTPGATRTYYGYELGALGARLLELTNVIGGPEIAFRPRIKTGDPTRIEWVMLAGTPAQPLLAQTGSDWIVDASVPQSMVSDIDVTIDATGMGTRVWEVGSGSQTGLMVSQADSTTLTSVGYPLLEVTDSTHNNETIQATLDSYSAASLTAVSRPAALWKVKVRNDGAPNAAGSGGPRLGQYQAGDYVTAIIGDDPYLAPGPRRSRILQIDGDLGEESVLTLATLTAEV